MALSFCRSGQRKTRKQRRKGNVESNAECATLLKKQFEQINTNWVSLEQKMEQGVLLV